MMRPMKFFLFLFSMLFISTCSKLPKKKFELFSPQAFAFDLGDSWEVNASLNVRGFQQNIIKDGFQVIISYKADLITPQSDTIKSLSSKIIEERYKTELLDLPIQIQLELDSTFSSGQYKLIVYVTDSLSKQLVFTDILFDIEKD